MLALTRTLLGKSAIIALFGVMATSTVFGQAATPPAGQAAAPQKNWKDRAEFDLYDAITKDATAASRLEKLENWKKTYPTSDFAPDRKLLYLATYQQLQNRPKDVIVTANDVLATDPGNFRALSAIVYAVLTLNPPTPEELATADQAAGQIVNSGDTIFAVAKKPEGIKDEDWAAIKKQTQLQAQMILGWDAMQRKDAEKAEAEFRKTLAMEPTWGQVDVWLGTVILVEKKPEKQSDALFYFARAVNADSGNFALPADGRKNYQAYLEKAYTQYHGSTADLDKLLAVAKANPTPPADFKVMSKNDLAADAAAKEADEAKKDPMKALWKQIKTELTGANGQAYFDASVKGALLPPFKGTLISSAAKTLVLAISDATTPDVTINLDAPLVGKMEPGGLIGFQGEAIAFTKDPYMVTFSVEKAKITGWTGKAVAAPHRPVVRKK